MKGECPMTYSRGIGHFKNGKIEVHPVFYDPILVWAHVNYPGKEKIAPLTLLLRHSLSAKLKEHQVEYN